MTAIDDLMRPWLDRIVQDTGPLPLYDAHTHVGRNDPDGFKQEPEQLLDALAAARARGVVFPMHEPGGYAAATMWSSRRPPGTRSTSSPTAA